MLLDKACTIGNAWIEDIEFDWQGEDDYFFYAIKDGEVFTKFKKQGVYERGKTFFSFALLIHKDIQKFLLENGLPTYDLREKDFKSFNFRLTTKRANGNIFEFHLILFKQLQNLKQQYNQK